MDDQKREIALLNTLFDVIERLGKSVESVERARDNVLSENGIVELSQAQTEFEDAREVFKIYKNNNPFTKTLPE